MRQVITLLKPVMERGSKRKDSPGSPVARPLRSRCRGAGLVPARGAGSHRPHQSRHLPQQRPETLPGASPKTCLPSRGKRAWFLVWEGPTCCRATEPVSHSSRARVRRATGEDREATDVKSPHVGLEGGPHSGGEALAQQ